MPYADSNSAWFNPHVRFLVLVCPTSVQPLSPGSWTHCIVGSWNTDDESRFVQVAAWDGTKFSFFSVSAVFGPFTASRCVEKMLYCLGSSSERIGKFA
jgi:hypothetical protein